LNTDFLENKAEFNDLANKTVYTGTIDAYFDFCFGELKYRGLKFDHQLLKKVENFQGNAVFNYTDASVPYTRIIEHKHFEFGTQPDTVISYEYPTEWQKETEPYYPVNDKINDALYARYKTLADQTPNVIFGGRLAEYKYYDMDKIVEKSLENFTS